MDRDEIDALRRQAEQAYAQWRACDSQRRRQPAAGADCTPLKVELDHVAEALFKARRPSLSMRSGARSAE